MTTPTTGDRNDPTLETASAGRERLSSRRKAVLVTTLVALAAAVAVVGLVFPGTLGAAIAIAVVVALVALDLLLPPREMKEPPETYWIM